MNDVMPINNPPLSKRVLVVGGLVGLAVSLILILTRSHALNFGNALLAIAIAGVGLAPSLYYLAQSPKQREVIPVMALTGLFYAVFFGLSTFGSGYLITPDQPGIQFYNGVRVPEISVKAQLVGLVGISAMIGVWGVFRPILNRRVPVVPLVFDLTSHRQRRALVGLAWVLALLNITYWHVLFVRQLPSVGQLLQPAGFAAFAIFYILWRRRELSRWQIVSYFWISVPVWFMGIVGSGLITGVILVLVFALAVNLGITGRIPWKLPLASLVVVLLVYPHLEDYRNQSWQTGDAIQKLDPSANVVERVVGLVIFVAKKTRTDGLGSKKRDEVPFDRLVRRISHILMFTHVVQSTPSQVPFWDGATYRTLITGWVPRIVWPEKPEERWGNAFGNRYGILGASDPHMSVNIPWMTELYANYGARGVVLGMAMIGIFMALVDRLINSPGASLASSAIADAALFPLFYQESNFTVMTGSLPPLILALWIFFRYGLALWCRYDRP